MRSTIAVLLIIVFGPVVGILLAPPVIAGIRCLHSPGDSAICFAEFYLNSLERAKK